MSGIITTLEEPKLDKWRETHIDYTESLGEAYKSFSIETYMTFEELIEIVGKMTGEGICNSKSA